MWVKAPPKQRIRVLTIEDIDYYLTVADAVDLADTDQVKTSLAIGICRMAGELKAHRSWAGIYGKSNKKDGSNGIHANANGR
jgi:hypothetical protein